MNRFFFLSTALFIATGVTGAATISQHAYAGSGTSCAHYAGHASVEGKWGSERSITETAAFVPLACREDRLLYGDVRLKADNRGNREGNVGLGVRALKENGVAGGYVYLDRRRSGATEKLFTQTTLGAEWLAEDWEVRSNAYVPLSGKKQMGTSGGEALSDPYLANNGIYVDVAGQNAVIEKPLWGVDAEAGLKLPGKDFWMHAGVFAFDASEAEGLAGGRLRATYKVTENIALTAEGQYDNVRGRQGWLGVRFTVPFGGPKEKPTGLKRRMTADPVRDVDIVTAAVEQEVAPAHTAPVENTGTGVAQRVLHVDNSAGGGGDGTLENPFNTLAAAQAVLQDFDILYINRGTGTTAGMNAGLTVAQDNVWVIGSGTDFVYDAGRFYAPVEENLSGTVLVAGGAAPVITNAGVNGDGINVTGANTYIGGVTVNGAARHGIYALAAAGVNLENVTVQDVTVSNNGQYGIWFNTAGAGALIGEATIRDVTASNNGDRGAYVTAATTSTIGTVIVDNLESHDSGGDHGMEISADGAGTSITDIQISDSEFYNNSTGTYIRLTNNALLDSLNLADVISRNNTGRGILVHALSGSDINTVEVDGLTAQSNTVYGLEVSAQAAGSVIGSTVVRNSSFTGNTNVGLYVNATTSSLINSVEMENITSSTNANAGVQVGVASGADIVTLDVDGITANSNTTASGRGFYLDVNGAGSTVTTATLNNITTASNGATGTYVNVQTDGQLSTLNANDVSSNHDDSRGIYFLTQLGGDIGTIAADGMTSINTAGAAGRGMEIIASGVGSTINSATVENSTFNSNLNMGLLYQAITSGVITTSVVRNTTASSNTGLGIEMLAQVAGSMSTVTLENITANSNAGRGVYIFAQSDGDIATATVDNLTAQNNTGAAGRGIEIGSTGNGSTIGNMTVENSLFSGNAQEGAYLYATTNTTTTTNTVNVTNVTSTANGIRGVYIVSSAAADMGQVRIDGLTSTNNLGGNGRGLEVTATGVGASIAGITLENSTFTGNAAIGAHLTAGSSASITTIGISDVTASANASQGLLVQAQSDGDIGTVTIEDTTTQNNTGANGVGLQVLATGAGSTVTSAILDNITSSGNANAGIYGAGSTNGVLGSIEVSNSHATGGLVQGILFDGVGNGSITTATVRNSVASGNTGTGVSARGLTGGDIGTFVARDMTVQNNTGRGITVSAEAANSILTSATVRDSVLSGNGGDGGVYILSQTTGLITAATVSNVQISNNVNRGLYAVALTGGDIGTLTIDNVTSNNNTAINGRGIQIQASNAGSTITTATVTNSTVTGNNSLGSYNVALDSGVISSLFISGMTATGNFQGIGIDAQTSASIAATAIQQSTVTNNTSSGIYINDDTTGSFVVDLGGGVPGSTGNNRIFSNAAIDVSLDYDNGQAKAENNWWGNAAGLQPGRASLEGTSTLDATPFLAADPGP